MSTDIEQKIVFAISPQGQGDGVPVIILGIPRGAWEYMRDGKTHNFDLTKVGVPVKIIAYGASTHAAAMKMIEGHIAGRGEAYLNKMNEDFSIKPKG